MLQVSPSQIEAIGQVVQDALYDARTPQVVLDGAFVTKQLKTRFGIDLEPFAVGTTMRQFAASWGFADGGLDCHGSRRWVARSPKYLVCPKHRCRSTLVVVRVNESAVFRAKHRQDGKSVSCHIKSIPISLLSTVLPDVGQGIRSQLLRICTTAKDLPSEYGARGDTKASHRSEENR
jgi:hypothetical protein